MNIYRLLSLRNTARAALKGRLPQRLVRRQIYRGAFHVAGWFSRLLKVSR